MTRIAKFAGAISCFLFQASAIVGVDSPPGKEETRKAALEFIQAWQAGNSGRMLEMSSLPWGWDLTEIYKTRDQLEVLIKDIVKHRLKGKIFTDKVCFVDSYKDFRGKLGKNHQRNWLDEILAPGDFVVAVEHPKDPKSFVYLFVKWRDGKATIAGYAGD